MMLRLDRLDPNPRNANVLAAADFKKLVANIKRTGHYPAMIVRPTGDRYMLLDGHHRRLALQKLGRTEGECQVWDVSEKEADIALASLNRLRGNDDPRKRAELVDEILRAGVDAKSLALMLPESQSQIEDLQLLMRADADVVAAMERVMAPEPTEAPPVKLTFTLFQGQYDIVRRALDVLLTEHELVGAKNADAQALEYLAVEYLSGVDAEAAFAADAEHAKPIGSLAS
jgi:ParB-like chromosome segregation protein Spo0J